MVNDHGRVKLTTELGNAELVTITGRVCQALIRPSYVVPAAAAA
jgi:hypothetical protein